MESKFAEYYLESIRKPFEKYKLLGEKTFLQLSEEQLFKQLHPQSNSVATLVKHLWGNMRSRWTDYLYTDGEKPWRDRDTEFENDLASKQEVLEKWKEGWGYFYRALDPMQPEDLGKTLYIRKQPYLVVQAIDLQLAHCAYHIGQIVYIGKLLLGDHWQSISIPKGKSEEYLSDKYGVEFPDRKRPKK